MRLWSSGFELNDYTTNTEWDGHDSSGGGLIQTLVVRSGTYAFKVGGSLNPSILYLIHALGTGNTDGPLFVRAYIRVAAAPTTTNTIIELAPGTGTGEVDIKLTTAKTLTLFDDVGQIGSASAVLTLNQWYSVEIQYDRTGGAGATIVNARLDGTQFAGATNRTMNSGVRYLYVGSNLKSENDSSSTLYFDDIAINDSTTSSQNTYSGSSKIIHLRPNATSLSQWVSSNGGANYTNVNEVTPDDAASYVFRSALNVRDLYQIDDSGLSATDTINVVQIGVRFNNNVADATTAFSIQLLTEPGDLVQGSSIIIPNSTTWKTNAVSNPNNYPISVTQDANNNPWTYTTLNAAQIGLKNNAGGTNNIQVSTMWALVDYTPAPITVSSTYGLSTPTANIQTTYIVEGY